MNEVRLIACITERDLVRYTPAGLAVSEIKLTHSSQVQEGEGLRTVEFELSAIAIGNTATQIQAAPLGVKLKLQGFLAAKSKHSKSLVFHVTELAGFVPDSPYL